MLVLKKDGNRNGFNPKKTVRLPIVQNLKIKPVPGAISRHRGPGLSTRENHLRVSDKLYLIGWK